jgi:hypothetical protein
VKVCSLLAMLTGREAALQGSADNSRHIAIIKRHLRISAP